MSNPSYVVATTPFSNGMIVQEVSYLAGIVAAQDSIHEVISRKIVHTGEEQIRQALIKLGWTPPPEGWKPSADIQDPPAQALAGQKSTTG